MDAASGRLAIASREKPVITGEAHAGGGASEQ